jgi:hypothetical protein
MVSNVLELRTFRSLYRDSSGPGVWVVEEAALGYPTWIDSWWLANFLRGPACALEDLEEGPGGRQGWARQD